MEMVHMSIDSRMNVESARTTTHATHRRLQEFLKHLQLGSAWTWAHEGRSTTKELEHIAWSTHPTGSQQRSRQALDTNAASIRSTSRSSTLQQRIGAIISATTWRRSITMRSVRNCRWVIVSIHLSLHPKSVTSKNLNE
jgi:hypothetical protein